MQKSEVAVQNSNIVFTRVLFIMVLCVCVCEEVEAVLSLRHRSGILIPTITHVDFFKIEK